MPIEFDRLYALEMPDRISHWGMDEIRSTLCCWYAVSLPFWFSPTWINEQLDLDGNTRTTLVDAQQVLQPVKYSGKIAGRIDRWLANFGRSLTTDQKSVIGDIAARHRMQAGPVYFDFTECFNWSAGDFGDEGSCFWGSCSAARDYLMDAGAFALRVYDPAYAPDELHGIGRAWVMPYPEDDLHVLFNGYMNHRLYGRAHTDDVTFVLGQLLAIFLGRNLRLVRLYNRGQTCGPIYINGGRGIIVGPATAIEGISRWDLEIADRHTTFCEACGISLDADEAYRDEWAQPYCSFCYHERFVACDGCGRTLSREDDSARYVEAMGSTYCTRCYGRYFVRCEECSQDVWRVETRELEGRPVCRDCFAERSADCDRCRQAFFADNLIEVEHNRFERLCRTCFDEVASAEAYGYAQAELPF
jgi:hypothetical protein